MLKFFWDWSPIGVLFFYFNSIWCKCPPFLRKTKFHLRGLSRMRAYVVCSLIYICIGTKSYFCCPLKYHSWSNHEHFIREKKEKRERLKEKYKMFLQWWSIKKIAQAVRFLPQFCYSKCIMYKLSIFIRFFTLQASSCEENKFILRCIKATFKRKYSPPTYLVFYFIVSSSFYFVFDLLFFHRPVVVWFFFSLYTNLVQLSLTQTCTKVFTCCDLNCAISEYLHNNSATQLWLW